MSGCVTNGSSCSLWPRRRKQTMSITTSLWNCMRKSSASLATKHDRLGIVAVHVEDRRLDHLRDVGAVERRARVARIRRREADLVVDDDVHRAAGLVAARLRQRHRLHHDALAREGRVAVDQQRQHLVAGVVAAAMLARAHRAFDHRVHDLEVRRVEGEREVDRAARGLDVRREALVVLHVARGHRVVRVLALELGEEIGRHLAEAVDQHVEPPAVRHADHDFLGALGAGVLDHGVERRDQALAALAREALLADVARVQVPLERLRPR